MAELLRAEGLGKVYGTAAPTRALQSVSFDLAEGEFASVVGQSGSGKSTLLNLVGLLDSPTEGTVYYRGSPAGNLPPAQRARLRNNLIGFVFQFHYLLPEFTVLENTLMPALIAGQRPEGEAATRAHETLRFLGLDEVATKNANDLSGGQKQRVAIARALMNRPSLVLADEPTGNLDSVNAEAVYELFRQVNERWGTAFLIVTHDRGIAQQTDRILEVKDGRLLQDVANAYAKPGPPV